MLPALGEDGWWQRRRFRVGDCRSLLAGEENGSMHILGGLVRVDAQLVVGAMKAGQHVAGAIGTEVAERMGRLQGESFGRGIR